MTNLHLSARILLVGALFGAAAPDLPAESSSTAPPAGVWQIQSRDLYSWSGKLTLVPTGESRYDGCIEWLEKKKRVGLERIRAEYEPEGKSFVMYSQALLLNRANLGSDATYKAEYVPRTQYFRRGYWFGDNVEAGVWEAHYLPGASGTVCR
jgi:hypothetical protein